MALSHLALDVPAFTSLISACGRPKRWDVALPGPEKRLNSLEGAPCAACGDCT